jgi:anti-sigma factor RsiW
MHLKDDWLRAYLDHELPAGQSTEGEEHLAHCAGCAARLQTLRTRSLRLNDWIGSLAPLRAPRPASPQSAFQRLTHPRKETLPPMFTKRPLWAALAALVIVVLVFTLTPASALANTFLSLFRVQKVAVVSFDPQALRSSQSALQSQSDVIKQLFQSDLVITGDAQPQTTTSLAEATQLAGFTPRVLNLGSTPTFDVKQTEQARFTIEQSKLQALIDAAGVNYQLPKAADGQVVTLVVPNSVSVTYGNCPVSDLKTSLDTGTFDCTVLMQLSSPTVDAPPALNVQQMGEAVFQFLGLSPAEALKLSNQIDWTTTLILPIPRGRGISYQDFAVDGVTGTLVLSTQDQQTHYALIWTNGGMLYSLTGPGGLEQAQQAVAALQ